MGAEALKGRNVCFRQMLRPFTYEEREVNTYSPCSSNVYFEGIHYFAYPRPNGRECTSHLFCAKPKRLGYRQ